MIQKFKACSDDVKLRLVTMFCYITVYKTVYNTHDMNTLSVPFTDVFTSMLNIQRGISVSSIYVENNVNSFKTLLRKAAYNFRVRLTRSGNWYINVMVSSVFVYSQSSFTCL